MRSILFVAEYFPPIVQGGGEVNLSLLSQALAERGFRVMVLTSWFPGLPREESVNGVTIVRQLRTGRSVGGLFGNVVRSLFFEASVFRGVEMLLKKQRFDVIHLIGSSLGCAERLRRLTAVPLAATVESYIALCPKGDFLCGTSIDMSRWSFGTFVRCLLSSQEIGKMKNRFFLKYNPFFWLAGYSRFAHLERNLRFVSLIAVSRFVRDVLKKNNGLESAVVPNFIDIAAFRKPQLRSMAPNRKPVVVYLGALAEHKGPQVLLEAAVGLDCRVELHGDGPLRERLRAFIAQHGLDAEIYAPVPYEQVPPIYARADLVAFPSLWPEPFGRIAIEALAAGVPIVASAIGGIEETVPRGAGILIEPGNSSRLRNALRFLLEHPAAQRRRSANGRAFFVRTYSKGAVVKKLINLYDSL